MENITLTLDQSEIDMLLCLLRHVQATVKDDEKLNDARYLEARIKDAVSI